MTPEAEAICFPVGLGCITLLVEELRAPFPPPSSLQRNGSKYIDMLRHCFALMHEISTENSSYSNDLLDGRSQTLDVRGISSGDLRLDFGFWGLKSGWRMAVLPKTNFRSR